MAEEEDLGAHPSLPHEVVCGAASVTLAEQMNPDLYSVLVLGDSESNVQANKPVPYGEEQTCGKVCFITEHRVFTWTAGSQVSLSLFSAGTRDLPGGCLTVFPVGYLRK